MRKPMSYKDGTIRIEPCDGIAFEFDTSQKGAKPKTFDIIDTAEESDNETVVSWVNDIDDLINGLFDLKSELRNRYD